MQELIKKIDNTIDKKAMETSWMGTKTVITDLVLTDSEKELFFKCNKYDSLYYDWEFDNNRLIIAYTRDIDINFYDEHRKAAKEVSYAQYKNVLAGQGYHAVKGTYDDDKKTIVVEHSIPRKWIVTIEDKEYTVYSEQKYSTNYSTSTFEVRHKQKYESTVSGNWYTYIYVDSDDEKIVEDCKFAFVNRDNFDKEYIKSLCEAYPEYDVYFSIKYVAEAKDVDLSSLNCVVRDVRKEVYGDKWALI